MEIFAWVALATSFQLILIEPLIPWRWLKVLITVLSSTVTLIALEPNLYWVMVAVQSQACSLVAGMVLLSVGKISAEAPVRLRSRIPPL